MMQHRLDKERALVLVSAVTLAAPGSASAAAAPDALPIVRVEHMQKVSNDESVALTVSMTYEWQSVLTNPEDGREQPGLRGADDREYWTPSPANKVRRMESDPKSPGPASG